MNTCYYRSRLPITSLTVYFNVNFVFFFQLIELPFIVAAESVGCGIYRVLLTPLSATALTVTVEFLYLFGCPRTLPKRGNEIREWLIQYRSDVVRRRSAKSHFSLGKSWDFPSHYGIFVSIHNSRQNQLFVGVRSHWQAAHKRRRRCVFVRPCVRRLKMPRIHFHPLIRVN